MVLTSISIQAVPLVLAAALAMQAGFYHLTVYKRRRNAADGYFVACCFTIALYAAFFSLQLCVTDAATAVLSVYVQLWAVNLFGPSLLWFIHAYTRQRSNRFAQILTAAYLLLFVLSIAGPREWLSGARLEHALHVTPWSATIPYLESQKGPLADLQMALHLVGIPYVTGLCALHLWRRRDGKAAALLLAILVVCVAAANDIAVYEGWIRRTGSTISPTALPAVPGL